MSLSSERMRESESCVEKVEKEEENILEEFRKFFRKF